MTETLYDLDPVLVANRGEIALRIMRTARRMGLGTIAIYSDADVSAPHVRFADQAIRIGPRAARESYLNIERVLDAAAATGARAVHPGYGFLAENHVFAEACQEHGLVFVGPPANAIRVMGDKATAKTRMSEVGVPVLPGYEGDDQAVAVLGEQAELIGLPLMVKAASGGGGKGMRLVRAMRDLEEAIDSCRREASSAFGDDKLILERALTNPSHVEVQVLADRHGRIVTLGERDCSVQRRHQKLIEEAPSPAVDEELRRQLQEAAVTAASEVGYVGAGTVEFLVAGDASRAFYFLEMNTRLQVEHPVTELVTGLDLVEWQFRVARGEELEFSEGQLDLRGHAIEARLYAEDPANNFLPSSGRISLLEFPNDVRVDSGVECGSVVDANYDSMLAKVIAQGPTRELARQRLIEALTATVLLGIRTNRSLLIDVLNDRSFAEGEPDTGLLDSLASVAKPPLSDRSVAAVAATVLHQSRTETANVRSPGLAGWSTSGSARGRLLLRVNGDDTSVVVSGSLGCTGVEFEDGGQVECRMGTTGIQVDDAWHEYRAIVHSPNEAYLWLGPRDYHVFDELFVPNHGDGADGEGVLLAPMHGKVASVNADVGQSVQRGDVLVVVEAMKMEHTVRADVDGTVVSLSVAVGASVAAGAVLARIQSGERPDS